MKYELRNSIFPSGLTPIEKVLYNRGVLDSQHYLNLTDNDILNPQLIERIDEGIKMLISHISQNDKVLIQVDSDCDGYTSASLLINYLNCLFPGFVQNNISYRIHTGKQHGIILDTIPDGVKLVIAPDSSSNDYEQHKTLKESGIDVLVIDHHEAEKISNYACIINNQLCDYPTKSLSGVGMVYKFCQRIDQIMNVEYADLFLDLVALGMVADMMDLRDYETRRLVDKGLKNIRNPYFKEMVKRQAFPLRDGITPFGIAFYIAPFVNATVRSGTQDEKLILFESMLDYRGYELIPSTKKGCKGQVETRVEQAGRNCINIKNRQTNTRDKSLDVIKRIIEEQDLLKNKILFIALGKQYATDKNVTGLIANELANKLQRPILILTQNEKDETLLEGSARGYEKSELKDFKAFLHDSGYFEYTEGHANAFGAGIKVQNVFEFLDYSNNVLSKLDFSPCYRVDFLYQGSELIPNEITEVAGYKHLWGQGVEEPLIAIENLKVHGNNVQLLSRDKNPTLKITLPNGVSLIKFRSSEEEYEKLYSETGCVSINLIGKPEQNNWNGIISPQIMIEDYEIVGQTKYYF